VQVLVEYLHLWELLSNVELQPEMEDIHIWKFTTSGVRGGATRYAGWAVAYPAASPACCSSTCIREREIKNYLGQV